MRNIEDPPSLMEMKRRSRARGERTTSAAGPKSSAGGAPPSLDVDFGAGGQSKHFAISSLIRNAEGAHAATRAAMSFPSSRNVTYPAGISGGAFN